MTSWLRQYVRAFLLPCGLASLLVPHVIAQERSARVQEAEGDPGSDLPRPIAMIAWSITRPSSSPATNPRRRSTSSRRVPGFTLDDGGDKRGFGGAAGNVLINDRRPSTKQDSPSAILNRISAEQVATGRTDTGPRPRY